MATLPPFNPKSWMPDPSKNTEENLASFDAYFVSLMADIASYCDSLEGEEKVNGLSDSEDEVERLAAAGEEKEEGDADDEAEEEGEDDEDSQEEGGKQGVLLEDVGGQTKVEWSYSDDSWYNSDPEVDWNIRGEDSDSPNSTSSQYFRGRYI